jgi:hypothetical protein
VRINARLDETHFEKLEYLKQATRAGTTEVVKNAIDVYYRKVRGSAPVSALDILTAHGFIGSGEGEMSLSESYKDSLATGWSRKHGDR